MKSGLNKNLIQPGLKNGKTGLTISLTRLVRPNIQNDSNIGRVTSCVLSRCTPRSSRTIGRVINIEGTIYSVWNANIGQISNKAGQLGCRTILLL